MTATIDIPSNIAAQTPTSLATLNEYTHLNLEGYDWTVRDYFGRKQLVPFGDKELSGCKIYEEASTDGQKPVFGAVFEHETLRNLSVRSGPVASLADAVQWAAAFQWTTRKVGSLTWLAGSPDATQWYAQIGISEAQIFRSDITGKYAISRGIRVGNQLIKLELDDISFGADEPRVITAFEQASAIALTMTDYVLELIRSVEHGDNH